MFSIIIFRFPHLIFNLNQYRNVSVKNDLYIFYEWVNFNQQSYPVGYFCNLFIIIICLVLTIAWKQKKTKKKRENSISRDFRILLHKYIIHTDTRIPTRVKCLSFYFIFQALDFPKEKGEENISLFRRAILTSVQIRWKKNPVTEKVFLFLTHSYFYQKKKKKKN